MKQKHSFRIDNRVIQGTSTAVLAILAVGCTNMAPRRAKVNAALNEESKALTTAVVQTLENQPATQRDAFTETALGFARQDQRVEGLPLQPFDVPALLAGMGFTNSALPLVARSTPEAAREEVAERFAKQDALIARRAKLDEHLLELGAVAEEARNKRITRWTRFSVWSIGLLGSGVALIIFCPLSLPILGRALAWLVGKFPGLASSLGVVSVKAFDAVVRGIENAKSAAQSEAIKISVAPTIPVANSTLPSGDSRRSKTPSWIDQLQNELSREMDAAHKALVRARKTAVGN